MRHSELLRNFQNILKTSNANLEQYRRALIKQTVQTEKKMEGTWDVRVTLRNCQTGAPVRTVRTLITFSCAGTLVETGSDYAPHRRSSGQGAWRHIGERHYITVSRFFDFDAEGTFAETRKITRRIELSDDGKEFLATTCVEVFDTADSLIETSCATERGKRLE